MAESRAWVFSERGLPWDILNLTSQPIPTLPPPLPLPKDVPNPEEWIVVKVAFAGLNPGAIFQMTLVPPFIRKPTCVPEMDFSGTVIDVWHPDDESGSAQSKKFNKGDKVLAMLPASHTLPTGTGALAEYVRIPARYAVKKPEGVSLADGAGCLLPGLTARQLVSESGAKTGDRVLVNAASGGIGSLVVQMLRKAVGPGGHIVGICSGKNVELVKSLGADEVIDYTKHDQLSMQLAERFSSEPFNAIIDTLGHQALYLASPSYLVPEGNYSSVGIKPPTFFVPDFLRAVLQMKLNEWWPISPWLGGVGRRWLGTSMMSPTLDDRQAVADMLGLGDIKLVKDSIWPFEETKEAYRKLGGLHARGKILVKVDGRVGDNDFSTPVFSTAFLLFTTLKLISNISQIFDSKPPAQCFWPPTWPLYPSSPFSSAAMDEYYIRLLSVKLTGSFSNTEYISPMTQPVTVFTVLPYKGSAIDCSPSQCPAPQRAPGSSFDL
ncbi:Zinc-type alcohol dehydrogenase [Fusarium acutatum]|uniref:Zinc-type alcohol dehydrogenase n=1 Tax=Fusarium acutatum TaxID=78861 RepID=A0A8H4JSB9_9HYPO|nr:Zinc-type alcohol dehydrogenase [Fusarium acutatum]